MINHTNQGHTISFPNSVVETCGNKLVLVNPPAIKELFDAMVQHYPVKHESLPTLKTTNITSETLPETYAVCSSDSFKHFISELRNSVDLITLNDFLAQNKIGSYEFDLTIH